MKHRISSRELEVLNLIKDGLTNPQIADKLVISLKTVENHVRSLLRKLKATNRTQAVIKALQLDVIEVKRGYL